MTDKELLNLADRCITHLNKGGQPITLDMRQDAINKIFSTEISLADTEQLYEFLTGKTGLCRTYGSIMGGLGVSIHLTDLGLMVMRDFGSYSQYLRKKLHQRVWRIAEGLMVIVTFVLVCLGSLNDQYFEGLLKQIRDEQPQSIEQPSKEIKEREALRASEPTEGVFDSTLILSTSSDAVKSKQSSLPVQD